MAPMARTRGRSGGAESDRIATASFARTAGGRARQSACGSRLVPRPRCGRVRATAECRAVEVLGGSRPRQRGSGAGASASEACVELVTERAQPTATRAAHRRHQPYYLANCRRRVLDRLLDLIITDAGVVARRELASLRLTLRWPKEVVLLVRGRQWVHVRGRRCVGRSASGSCGNRIADLACGCVRAQARERSCVVRLPPSATARTPSIAIRGRASEGACASNSGNTRSAQLAAQRSGSLRVLHREIVGSRDHPTPS